MSLSLTLLAVVLGADPGACPRELFRIERSKNANVVLYEVTPGEATVLDRDAPVTASWLLLASSGKREPLTFFEKLFAYGFEVQVSKVADSATLTLKALKARAIRVSRREQCPVATTTVGGAEAVLQRVYVATDEGGAVPGVKYVELIGVDVVTGEARTERVVPPR